MKKLLLISYFLISMHAQAQDFWTEFSTAQPITSTGIRSISIVNQSVTWLNMSCGTNGCTTIRRFAKTTNGGSLWTTAEIDLGPDSNKLEIANISGVSSTVAYAAVNPKQSNTLGGIWKTQDGGTTWTKQPTARFDNLNVSFPNGVHFWNANEGVAVGDPTDGYFEIYTTSDGGENWTRVPSSLAPIPIDPYEYGETGLFKVKGNSIWCYTTFGRLLRSADKGITWTVSQTPIPDFGGGITQPPPPDFAFSDENNGLLQSSAYELWKTNDGGVTWETVPWSGMLRDFGISAVPGLANTYISVGEDLDTGFERGSSYSIDGGLNWIDINNNPDTNFVDGGKIAMLNEDYGFASGFSNSPTEGGIFRWGGGPMLRNAILTVSTFSGDKSITVSPNPLTDLLNITGKNITQVKVFDVLGKQMIQKHFDGVAKASVNLDFLASGIYIVNISNDQGTSMVKVMKR